jgi:hypothetical protein
MGLLAALLSALLLLPTLLGVADWQAGRAEQRELELLRQHSAQRIGDFFASLYASLERVEALSAERCTAGSRDELQQRAAAELFVVGFSRTLPDGRSCRTLRLPSAQALQGYRHWRLDDVDIWWQPQRLQDPLQPSLRRDEFELDYQPLVDLASGCARTCSSRRPRTADRSPRSPAG